MSVMKTIDCFTFATLVRNHERLNLVDIRPKEEFTAGHIPGAQSIPLSQLVEPRISWQKPSIRGRVYVIANDVPCASLASGSLRGSGIRDVVAVEGGMPAWIQQGLPVRGAKSSLSGSTLLAAAGMILGLAAGITFAVDQIATSIVILLGGGLLFLNAGFARPRSNPSNRRSRKAQGDFMASRTPLELFGSYASSI